MKTMQLFLICAGLVLGLAWTGDALSADSEEDAALVRDLEDNLIATCCWTQPISQHESPTSDQMKAEVRAMVAACHARDLPVIYHGCGNVKSILGDFIEFGLDAYNPLEAKANLDVIKLRKEYGHQVGFCGNSNIQVWETGDRDQIRREVLRKLNAAKGGGYIFQSDHSVSSSVTGDTYDFIVKLVREFGHYPLELGEYDIKI